MISETNALAERVRRLEQQNRVIRWIAAGILFLVIVAGLEAQQRPVRTIEAEKFVLLDSKGRARVTIATPNLQASQLTCQQAGRQFGFRTQTLWTA